MRRLNKSISLFSRSLLLVLFIGYAGSIIMFYHTHEVNGFLITHSHPFKLPAKKGSVENHSHTTSQFILLQQLCETSITDSIVKFVVVPDPHYYFCRIIPATCAEFFYLNITGAESLRAPPAC